MTIYDLEALINRLRSIQPATGVEARLASDVSILAGIYGRLIFARQVDTNALESSSLRLSEAERALLERLS
jgi:Protein of unknown function (DUF3717)